MFSAHGSRVAAGKNLSSLSRCPGSACLSRPRQCRAGTGGQRASCLASGRGTACGGEACALLAEGGHIHRVDLLGMLRLLVALLSLLLLDHFPHRADLLVLLGEVHPAFFQGRPLAVAQCHVSRSRWSGPALDFVLAVNVVWNGCQFRVLSRASGRENAETRGAAARLPAREQLVRGQGVLRAHRQSRSRSLLQCQPTNSRHGTVDRAAHGSG